MGGQRPYGSGRLIEVEMEIEKASKAVRDCSIGLYILAGGLIIVGFFLRFSDIFRLGALVYGVVCAVSAFLLRNLKSRTVAVILLLSSSVALILSWKGSIFFLTLWPLVALLESISAVQATFRLHKLLSHM